ncbi:hypothetical protein Bca101_061012 [Brassica carinata]
MLGFYYLYCIIIYYLFFLCIFIYYLFYFNFSDSHATWHLYERIFSMMWTLSGVSKGSFY